MEIRFTNYCAYYGTSCWTKAHVLKKAVETGGFMFGKNWIPAERIQWLQGQLLTRHVGWSQDSIARKFGDGSNLYKGIEDIKIGKWDPVLQVVMIGGKWYSLNNRRLWCVKNAMKKLIQVEVFEPNGYAEERDVMKKMTTRCKGKYITVRRNKL